MIAAVIGNAHGGKGRNRPFEISDFDVFEKKKPQTQEEAEAVMRSFAASVNRRHAKQKKE